MLLILARLLRDIGENMMARLSVHSLSMSRGVFVQALRYRWDRFSFPYFAGHFVQAIPRLGGDRRPVVKP